MRAASGRLVRLRVSGTGLNLAATPGANGSTTPVFYAPTATVQALHGVRGYNYLGFRLTDDSTAAQSRVIAEVRAYLTAQTGTDPITALPAVRAPGQWPGQSGFGHIMALLYIITILAFASALFLISATMNTLIAEQAGEIAILKTLGGRRRQIAGITVRTAAMLGAAGAVLGTILGIAIAYLLAGYFAVKLIDVSFGFAISVPVVVASLVLGPALAVAASLPALRRALRRPVAETLAGTGTSGYGSGRLDRLAARSGLLAGTRVPGSMRMGVRNALRQKRRSTATIAQVAVAAGLAIAFLALGQSVTAVISQTIGTLHFSIGAGEAASQRRAAVRQPGARHRRRHARSHRSRAGRDQFRAVQRPDVRGVGPGCASPLLLPAERGPLVHHRRHRRGRPHRRPAGGARPRPRPRHPAPASGRSSPSASPRDPPASASSGSTPARTNNGDTVYFPLPVLERLDGGPGTADSIWLATASSGHAAIDRATAAAANRLAAAGYPVSTTEIYVTQAQITAADTAILTIVEILGLVVVAIMLMGLVSALSMGVIERTREVGILRCVGARARHIRRVFSAEAMILAVAGWAFGVLLGWLIYQGLLTLLLHDAALSLPQEFPPVIPLITLAGVLVLTLIVIRGPLRRATRIQPGTALRYQ